MRARSLAPLALAASLGFVGAHPATAAICDGISTAPATPLTTVKITGAYLRPLLVTSPPGDTSRLFIVEQDGTIRIVKDGVLLPTAFLNISALTLSPADPGADNEEGLLGLAFHPNYAVNGLFYVYHTDSTGSNLLVRYARSAGNPDVADTTTRQVLFTFLHPGNGNHNGGMMAFSANDGRLYVGTGDGGGGCDGSNNAQTDASPLGKLHRIDVDAVPPTIETWAKGLRNPWRWSFDRLTNDLYIGDVGQNAWEEIDFRPAPRSAGDNFGWRVYEGSHCDPNPSCPGVEACSTVPNAILPITEYDHGSGCSVTGGYVYRGCRMPALAGRYFYSDFCSAFIKSFRVVGGAVSDPITHTAELAPGGGLSISSITSYGEDARGEIYIVDRGGEVFKIVPILPNLEVSGPNAPFLTLDTSWTWENLQLSSDHPISQYRVYRTAGNGSGTFDCEFQSATPSWPGGDPEVPPVGSLFSYLVVARNAAGQQTSPGTGTGGTPRTLSALACPS